MELGLRRSETWLRVSRREEVDVRIAVMSDVHGNCLALDAVIADLRARRVDQVVCLGDAIQGGPQPAETVARLRELGCPVVMGNADAWLLTGEDSGAEPITAQGIAVREWSLSRLSAEDRAFIGSFQPTVTMDLGGGQRLLCFHGSPDSFDDVITPETPQEEVARLLGSATTAFLTGGHTHRQQVRRVGDATFFNPGSLGLAYSSHYPGASLRADPWAEYAILTTDDGGGVGLEFRRVPYDVAELFRIYRASGRPFAEEAIAQYGKAGSKNS
jgi:predicted phosphodiesterase